MATYITRLIIIYHLLELNKYMKKNIIINLKNIYNEELLPDIIYKAIECNYESKSVYNGKINWDSLIDNLSGIKINDKKITKLVLIFTNTISFIQNCGLDLYLNLISALVTLTDPSRRVDGLEFYIQIREEEYNPEKESLHIKLHRGEDGGKDINN